MSFASLGLSDLIVRAVTEHGYTEPTPIQKSAIPAVLGGRDMLAGAQTGTGKTAGFVLPILQRLTDQVAAGDAKARRRVSVLILTPTRELAAQIEESVRVYGKYTPVQSTVIFGGVGMQPQVDRLARSLDILVATPGRLLDHVQQRTLDLSTVKTLVLDEADRMLDMGFIRDVKRILALLPKQRQNLLFSATFADEIRSLADSLLHEPMEVEVARRNATAELVEQRIYVVRKEAKRHLLARLIKEHDWHQVLVFTRTKHGANRLAEQLTRGGITALAIHGNKSQTARTRALAEFKDGSTQVLVATDIAARGIDIKELPHVVNFDLPNVPEDYVHRIGRTGRASMSGEAISLIGEDDMPLLGGIERLIKRKLPRAELSPEDMAALESIVKSAGPDIDTRPPLPPRGGRPGGGRSGAGRPGGGRPGGGRPSDGRPGDGRQPGARQGARPAGGNTAPRGEVDGNRIDAPPQRSVGSVHQPRGSGQPDGRMGRSDNRQGRDNNRSGGVGMGRGFGVGRGSR